MQIKKLKKAANPLLTLPLGYYWIRTQHTDKHVGTVWSPWHPIHLTENHQGPGLPVRWVKEFHGSTLAAAYDKAVLEVRKLEVPA